MPTFWKEYHQVALTDGTIQAKAKSGDRPFKLFAGKGLFLLVKPNDARY